MFRKTLSAILIGSMLATSVGSTAFAGVDPIIMRKDQNTTESTPEYTAPEETPYSKAEDEAAKELTNVYLDLKDVDQTKIKSEMSREDANPIIKLAESIIEKMKELLNKLKQAFKETFYADRGTVTIKYLCVYYIKT